MMNQRHGTKTASAASSSRLDGRRFRCGPTGPRLIQEDTEGEGWSYLAADGRPPAVCQEAPC